VFALLLVRLKEKELPGGAKCWYCGHLEWEFPGYVPLSLSADPRQVVVGGPNVAPTAILVCGYCGNTLFLNLFKLGFHPSEYDALTFKEG